MSELGKPKELASRALRDGSSRKAYLVAGLAVLVLLGVLLVLPGCIPTPETL